MDNTKSISFGVVVFLLHTIINTHLSKEIIQWIPSQYKRLLLLLCVWLVPIIGISLAYKTLNLDWFKQRRKKDLSGHSFTSGAFLEMDSILNLGHKHVIAERQKENIELKEGGDV